MACAFGVLMLALTGVVDGTRGSVRGGVSPELSPKSDKKFFGKDYPDDLRPGVKDHFHYPFPIVQESQDYDKDYVKDENSDGGEWKAQADYDHLRTKLSNLKSDAEKLKRKEDDKEKDLVDAEEKVKKAQEEAQAAKDAADAAEKAEEARKEELGKHAAAAGDAEKDNATATDDSAGGNATGAEGGNGTNGSEEVTKAEMDLEECMKQLADANAKLEKLIEEKKKREAEHAERLSEESKAAAEEAAAAGSEAELAEKRRLAEEAHQNSLKSLEEEQKDLERLQKQLEDKAKTLRKFREQQLGDAGGLYHDPDAKKSGVGTYTRVSLLVGLVTAVGAAASCA